MPILVLKNNKQFGPFDLDELTGYVQEGNFLLTDYCWQEGWDEWLPIHSIICLPVPTLVPLPRRVSTATPTKSPNISPRKLFFAGGVVIAFLIVCYLSSPYWALYRLKRAVDRNDAVFVADRVDFPLFRESFKGVVMAKLAKEAVKDDAEGFEALGAAFGAMMIGPMVDALVTPEGLIQMMQGREMGSILEDEKNLTEAEPGPISAEDEQGGKGEGGLNVARMSYETLNRFTIMVRGSEDSTLLGGESVTLLFSRRGLTGWQLSGMRMGSDR